MTLQRRKNKGKKMSEQDWKKIVGCSPDDFVEYANSIYKMMWEQVLLLALYARQQFIEQEKKWGYPVESKVNFENKLKLVDLLFVGDNDDSKYLQDKILEKIERYEDIHSITNYLMSDDKKTEESVSLSAKSLLHNIAKHHISFISKEIGAYKHPYSYYAMHKIIQDPLSVFQSLLNINFSKSYIHGLFLKAIQKVFKGSVPPDSPNYNSLTSLEACKNLELADINFISEYNFSLENTSEKIHSFISKKLGEEVTNIFNIFKIHASDRSRELSVFERMVDIDKSLDDSQNKVLRINNKALESLISLGKIDSVVEAIKNKFLDISTPREKLEFPIQDKKSLKEVVVWYDKVKTELCPTITDCPSLVASILEFDFRNNIGVFNPYNGIKIPIHKNTWFAKDGYLLVTGFIRRFLFKKGHPIELFKSSSSGNETLSTIPVYINNLYDNKYMEPQLNGGIEELMDLNNSLMKDWANLKFNEEFSENSPQYTTMMNRFKKLPIYLKSPKSTIKLKSTDSDQKPHKRRKQGIWSIYDLISMQKASSKKASYPIDSSFPLPLWVDFNISEQEKKVE